jgi:lysyl-tRNA synthetase class 2
MNELDTQNNTHNDENHLINERRQKLKNLRAKKSIYLNQFVPSKNIDQILHDYNKLDKEQLLQENINVNIAGRMMFRRVMGKASFAVIQDGIKQIQIYLSKNNLDELLYEEFKHYDIGDILGIEGSLFRTKTDELTIDVKKIIIISKCLRPLPEKFHGLTDQEQCYRQRYLDLIMNNKTKEVFIKRSQIIQKIREFLVRFDYLEVETPMMHPIPGGATAKPFITHHNALDMELFLRIAPELYLKRLIVGGLNKVFEINRNFRNEGLSTRHNPEFTMLEFYESYANYQKMMLLTESILKECVYDCYGKLIFEYQGVQVNFDKPFDKLTITESIVKYTNYSFEQLNNIDFIRNEVEKITKAKQTNKTLALLQLMLFEATTEHQLWNPTYIIDYPIDISPLARKSDNNHDITERFELFVVGRELANGYSELNDPEDQADRFKKQVEQKDSGDEEAMHYDADYIKALEYGMPHTGGCGIGIDRLVMLLTNSASIRDVLLFPQLRHE